MESRPQQQKARIILYFYSQGFKGLVQYSVVNHTAKDFCLGGRGDFMGSSMI